MGHGYIWAKTALCCCRRRRRRCLFYTVHVQNLSRSVASPLSQLQQEFSELLLLLVSSFLFRRVIPTVSRRGLWFNLAVVSNGDVALSWYVDGLEIVIQCRKMTALCLKWAFDDDDDHWLCSVREKLPNSSVCVCVYSEKEIPWLRFFTLASDESTRNTQNPPSCLVWSTSIFPNPESSKGVKLSVSCCCRKIIDSGVTWWSGVTVTTPKKCFIPRTVFI